MFIFKCLFLLIVMLVFPGVFGRGRFSELWGFLMICWVSSRRFLGMCPAVLSFWSSLHPSLFWKSMLRKQTKEQMGDWSLPKKRGENFCGRPLCCRAASTRCRGFSGQKSKTSRVMAVANLQVWMEEFMKHIHVCIKKKSYLHTRINKNFLLNFCQTSMHFFWDCTGFEGISHPFAIHLRRTKNHPLQLQLATFECCKKYHEGFFIYDLIFLLCSVSIFLRTLKHHPEVMPLINP